MQPAKVYYQADEKFAARALKKTHVNLVNNNNVQQALRCICDKRSHGWRSARLEPGMGSWREKQLQRSAPCAKPFTKTSSTLNASKETSANQANTTNIQQALCCICDKRSHGWRSARLEPGMGSWREKQLQRNAPCVKLKNNQAGCCLRYSVCCNCPTAKPNN